MRQYRGLTKDGKWVYGWYIEIGGRSYIEFSDGKCNRYTREVIPETVGQQIGLKDKNGTEIYKGDIVYEAFIERFGYFNIPEDCQGREMYRNEITGVVEYCKEDCSFKIRDEDEGLFLTESADELEVIGNISEHPKLLENNNVKSNSRPTAQRGAGTVSSIRPKKTKANTRRNKRQNRKGARCQKT